MGGKAIKISSRINQENIIDTLSDIYNTIIQDLHLSVDDIGLLGSSGKKPKGETSGDIDIAISMLSIVTNNTYNGSVYDFLIEIVSKYTSEIKDMRQMGIISIAYPIHNYDHKQSNSFVQLDLMLVDNLEWAKWAFYSPFPDVSEYKGLYRNEIMYSIAKHMNYKCLEEADDADGRAVCSTWERYFFDLSNGLMKGTQTINGKKGLIKNAKTIKKTLFSNIVSEVISVMFWDGIQPTELYTFEQTLNAVMDKRFSDNHPSIREEVLNMTKWGIEHKGQVVPKILLDAIAETRGN